MIFFLILTANRNKEDYTSIKAPLVIPDKRNQGVGNLRLIAWNEVYPTLDDLKQAVIAAAKSDPVCIDMRNQALDLFGIDPFLETYGGNNLTQQQLDEIVNKIFLYWAHPMIGNVTSKQFRELDSKQHYVKNWDTCSFIDDGTRIAIKALYQMLGEITVSGRDQIKISYNISELARSIIGEITSDSARRLEKILALRLCQSQQLLDEQALMLNTYMQKRGEDLHSKITQKKNWAFFEYCSYYLPEGKNLNPEQIWILVNALIESAVKPAFTPNAKLQPYITKWEQIPNTIRCAILMNDIRRVGGDKETGVINEFVGARQSLYTINSCEIIKTSTTTTQVPYDLPYALNPSASNAHVPVIIELPWSFMRSWNRDEYHPGTIMYRHFLCPLWAGPSGHSTGTITFWMNALGDDFPPQGAVIITSSLFALWRLYYDKRRSGNHTLVESVEASCISKVTGIDDQQPIKTLALFEVRDNTANATGDAMTIIKDCLWKGSAEYISLDPIALFKKLRELYYMGTRHDQAYIQLQTIIDAQRDALVKAGLFVPQWEAELGTAEGTSTARFVKVDPLPRLKFQSNPVDRTTAFNEASNIMRARL